MLFTRKMKYIVILLIALMAYSVASFGASWNVGTTGADFIKMGKNTKTESMGGALTASSELNALAINPASIGGLNKLEFSLQSQKYILDMAIHHINCAIPTKWGNFALDALYMDMGSQIRTSLTDRAGISQLSFNNSGLQIMGAYALEIKNASIGIAMKFIQENLDDSKAEGIGVNLGLNYHISSQLSLGLAVNNITVKSILHSLESANLPQEIRTGISYQTLLGNRLLMLTCDLVGPVDDAVYVALGLEYQVYNILMLRLGYSTYQDVGNFSLGLGINVNNLTIDFMYRPYEEFHQSYLIGFGLKL